MDRYIDGRKDRRMEGQSDRHISNATDDNTLFSLRVKVL